MTQTAEQRDAALLIANDRRTKRAALKRELRGLGRVESRERVIALMRRPPAFLAGMPVHSLLAASTRCGPVFATRILSRAMIRESRPVGDLTARQVNVIAHEWRRQAGECECELCGERAA